MMPAPPLPDLVPALAGLLLLINQPEAASPPIVAVDRDFWVYFEPSGVSPTSDTAASLNFALRHAAEVELACFLVIGHTDTVGPGEINEALSVRRAQAVAASLRRGGFEGVIRYAGRGETDLARPTGDGQDEPLNRRVLIYAASARLNPDGCPSYQRGRQTAWVAQP